MKHTPQKEDIFYRLWSPLYSRYRGIREYYTEGEGTEGLFSWEEALETCEGNNDHVDIPAEVMVPADVENGLSRAGTQDITPVLIWSEEHRGWWRAGRCGYTQSLDQAGVYPIAEAIEIVSLANKYSGKHPDEGFVPLSAYPALAAAEEV